MKTTKITDIELFEPILDIDIENKHFDLHNDFDCKNIYLNKGNTILFDFQSIKSNNRINITFTNAEIAKAKFSIIETAKQQTLSNFYRGRFQNGDGTLKELNKQGQKYFYLDFSEGQQLEIFATEGVVALFEN